jgi:hypothetical protein
MPALKAELPTSPVPPAHQANARPLALALRAPVTSREISRLEEAPAPTVSVAKQESPIVAESHSLASVIEPWHRAHNASAALALLDAHEQRYPNGHMRLETRMLRAEIYLAQGRETEALAVLDSLRCQGSRARASCKPCVVNCASRLDAARRASEISATCLRRAWPIPWPSEPRRRFTTVPETFAQVPSLGKIGTKRGLQ